MEGMHFADSIVIFLLALILFGPKKLPEIARQAGKLMAEFRRASNEFKAQIDEELRAMEQQERQAKLEASAAQTPALAAPNGIPTAEDIDPEVDPEVNPDVNQEFEPYADPDESGEFAEDSAAGGSLNQEEEKNIEPVILPPSTGEPVSAERPYMPVAPPELLEAAALDPHPLYAEALAAEQNASSNHSGAQPESAQAAVNHG